jgi:hypothetical protein
MIPREFRRWVEQVIFGGIRGVRFHATQVPSADVNVLDDYEEGTWTPSDGSGAGLNLTGVGGTYVKLGKLVWATFTVTYPATADATAAKIAGLPFTSQTADSYGTMVIRYTTSATPLGGYVLPTSTLIFITNGVSAAKTNAQLSTLRFDGMAMYLAAA